MAAKKSAKKAPRRSTAGKPAPAKAAPKKAAARPARKVAAKPVSAAAAADKARRDREVYKVSPLRGMPVDDWIQSKTSGWQSEVVRRVAAVVERAAPDATCSIKWAQPVWEHGGPVMFLKPAKAHVSIGFWRGNEIVDPAGVLERGGRMGHFKLRGPGEPDEAALAAMVKDAVRLNKEKGNPSSGR